jgi:hypothetical protein
MKEFGLPTSAQRGMVIELVDYQTHIRKYAEKNADWPYASVVAKWYPRVEEVKRRFFDGVLKPWDLSKLPSPPVAIEPQKWKTLASYRLVPDGYGLSDKLTLNEGHFKQEDGAWVWDYGGDWGLAETIVHEMAHEWYKHKGKTKPSHNKEFRNKLLDLGIYCDSRGAHFQIADADSPFGILMKEWGIKRPDEITIELPPGMDWFKFLAEGEKPVRGRSTLKKWCCPECGLNVRMGIAGDPMLRHHTCEEAVGQPVFLIPGDVYVAKK